MIRLFHPLPENTEGSLTVTGERHHYLTRVLRLSAGDALEVFDGKGRAFAAKVRAVEESSSRLELGEPRQSAQPRPVTVIQGLPKGDKLEWIIQKGTELGAASFIPASTARSIVKIDAAKAGSKTARWQKIAEEAARQCGRNDVPTVLPPSTLEAAVASLPADTRVLVLDEEEHGLSLSQAVSTLETTTPIAFVIGPEGGLERGEVHALSSRGAVAVTLGGSVLRTETASMAALCVLLHLDGRLG